MPRKARVDEPFIDFVYASEGEHAHLASSPLSLAGLKRSRNHKARTNDKAKEGGIPRNRIQIRLCIRNAD